MKDKQTAEGKTKDEAIMLLNHKDVIDFVVANSDYFLSLSIAKMEELHSILIKELGVDRNIRTRRVGITGTNYRPLENEFQIREALQQTCDLINNRSTIFEKTLFALVLLSYLQAFTDGNKRVARITANALLIDEYIYRFNRHFLNAPIFDNLILRMISAKPYCLYAEFNLCFWLIIRMN